MRTHSAKDLLRALQAKKNPARAKMSAMYLQAKPGGYGEGDRFLGLTVPQVRESMAAFVDLPLADVRTLLKNPWHEARLAALLILVAQWRTAKTAAKREALLALYLRHTKYVNNWDLVDSSAADIVGGTLHERGDFSLLTTLVRSSNVWENRIAMVATHYGIRRGKYAQTVRIAEMLLTHPHPLLHKATGWMLREMGKKDEKALLSFLDAHAAHMPRTALRYALERLSATKKGRYMRAKSRQ